MTTSKIIKYYVVAAALFSTATSEGAVETYDALTSVKSYRGDAVIGDSSPSGFVFKNMRFTSDQTTFADYVIGTYKFSLVSQKLSPVKFEVFKDVGIYEPINSVLLKNAPDGISIYQAANSSTKFPEGTPYTLTSGIEYLMDLKVGQSLCMKFSQINPNQAVKIIFSSPNGKVSSESTAPAMGFGGYFAFDRISILDSGTYKIKLLPASGNSTFTYQVSFSNENFTSTLSVTSGAQLIATFSGAAGVGLPYRKFKLVAVKGKTINLPFDQDTEIMLINSKGAILAGPTNSGINHKFSVDGDCYIIIQPYDGLNQSTEYYSGKLSIN